MHTSNAAEAHVAAAALENAGIEAMIQGEHMASLPIGPNSHPSVWVRDEDYAAACDVLGVRLTQETRAERSPMTNLLWIALALMLGIILVRILRP